ncbi:alpha-amylase, partial [Candidatus Woesebacteria bacterium]|nr:alpha-amylase [Candidatus Woesebacteria bacterium]
MPALKSIQDIDWNVTLDRQFTPSPQSWSDQVMYFLLVDRFSDGNEKPELVFTTDKAGLAIRTENDAERWRAVGYSFCGGTLKGARSKLGYLYRLGITTIWLSPVLQQCRYDTTSYHGYGAQNFLEIDPHFGSKEDLKAFVDEAHQLRMFVVLDIVVNHAGFVFEYEVPVNSETEPSFKVDGQHPVKYFHDQEGKLTIPFGAVDLNQHADVWPH